MRHLRMTVIALATAAALSTTAACGNDSTGTGGVSLVGTYDLVTLNFLGSPAPGSTGTLAFTSTSFNATINLVSPNPVILPDTTLSLVGSYTAKPTSSADSIYLVLGVPFGTIGGTYAVSGSASDTLGLNLLTPLGPLGTVWHKR